MSAERLLAVAALVCAVTAPAWAETRVVEVSASVAGTERTPEEAQREALRRARDEAVAQAVGVRVAAQQLRLRAEEADGTVRDAFSSLVETSTEGRIVAERVTYRTRLENDLPIYEAALVAEVAIEEGARDPGFTLELATHPGSRTIRDGEALVVEATASRRCFLTLIHIDDDGTMQILVPNRFVPEIELAAGRPTRGPGKSGAFEIRARLPDGRERQRERLLAVATLDPVIFTPPAAGDDGFTALNRWLLHIPVARRVEALWEYEIAR